MYRAVAVFAFFPTAAFAEVCDKERPNWNSGPTGLVSEAWAFLTLPFFMWFLIPSTAVCLLLKNKIGCILMATIWAAVGFYVAINAITDPTTVHEAAVREGCIAPPHLFITLCAAISIATLYTALRQRKGASNTGD